MARFQPGDYVEATCSHGYMHCGDVVEVNGNPGFGFPKMYLVEFDHGNGWFESHQLAHCLIDERVA